MLKRCTLFVLFFFIINSTLAVEEESSEELTLQMVLTSSMHHYPMILESLKNVEAAKMKVKAALGAFDLKLKAESDTRPQGYYDGASTDIVLEKPLPYINSKIYMGHKSSEGEFPSYEGKVNTLDGGETRAGLSFSLWQDRDIDSRRLKVRLKTLNLSNKELKALEVQIKVKQSASKAYWEWVASGNAYKVHENLLKIALKRDKGLRERISKGDLAKIYQTENQQYIVKRKTKVIASFLKYQESTLSLSLFLRDKEGRPLLASDKLLPSKMYGEVKILQTQMEQLQKLALKNGPNLLHLDNTIKMLELEEQFGENKLKPRLDFSLEVSRDSGNGAESLQGTENRALLKFEIPIERNLGTGELRAARLKKEGLILKKRLTVEKMQIDTQKLLYRINAAVDKINNTDQEVQFASTLQKAEIQKFDSGASDFFVVNLREQNTADAKIKNIKAHLSYRLSLADYQAITLAFLNP